MHYASLNTDEGNDRSGKPFQMTVRCQNTRTEVFISWRTFLGTRGLEVTTRIDKSPALTSYWSVSTDNVASFMPQPVTTLKKFEGASRFLVNLTPYGEGPITAVFDISGSREAFNDIRRDCKW